MRKLMMVWMVLLTGWMAAAEMMSSIAVAYGTDRQALEQRQTKLQELIDGDATLRKWVDEAHATVTLDELAGYHVVRLGSFVPDERFATLYLRIREAFPSAVVVEQARPSQAQARASHPATPKTKTVVITAPSSASESDNTTIWIALFGLAIIGILYMFLSSDQLRRMKREHEEMVERQKKLELKQHSVLAQMGENIHTLAQETATHTHTLAQQAQGALVHEDVQKVIERENALLGMTGDLIKFLQIKAHKVEIQNAPFDFNNVLHEVAGTLQSICGRSDKELVFDVDRDVPKMMDADSLHMAQVLSNLIEYLMCHTPGREVYLRAKIRTRPDKVQVLEVMIRSDVGGIDEEKLFDAYYDEATGKYVGLGLFVAKELVELMEGDLTLKQEAKESTSIHLSFPVGVRDTERRQYRLTDPAIMNAKVLIIDRNRDVMRALEHLLAYFEMKPTTMAADLLESKRPHFDKYDIVAIDNTLWDTRLIEEVEKARSKGNLRVISLENLYASQSVSDEGIADLHMKKPLTQQHVLDVLIQLGEDAKPQKAEETEAPSQEEGLPEVYRGEFYDDPSIGLEDFARFSGRRLMIVEDNFVNQKVLKGMLSKAGLILTIANNGQEALDLLEESDEPMEMILMDISMPVMDGFEATQRIHSDPKFRAIPIVTLTALVSDHEVDKMFEMGANGYLAKPLKIGRLYSAMVRFLDHEAVSETPQSASAPALNADTGLDTRQAADSMQNNSLLYREVLNEFREIYGNSDKVFEKLIHDTRYEQLKMLCVDLRGLAGSIGAQRLFEVVTEIQTMLLYKKYDLLERQIEPYREELTKLNAAIDHYLS